MGFKVEVTFDAVTDLVDLVAVLSKPDPRVGQVVSSLNDISERIQQMNAALQARLDTLTQRVAAVDGAEQSVLALLTEMRGSMASLREELANSGVSEEQLASLDALNDKLSVEAQQIAEAVAGPAQPQPEPAPTPAPEPVPPVEEPAPAPEPVPVPDAPVEAAPPVVEPAPAEPAPAPVDVPPVEGGIVTPEQPAEGTTIPPQDGNAVFR